MTVRNPILRGFHPDPSIVRIGENYYIATSTFEWFPGVRIYHSRDLAHWRLAARPLVRASQLDMRGAPDSCGVWAPDLSYANGRFHLIYTDVKRYGRTTVDGAAGASLRDFHNYWVWSDRVDGDWSDPVHLNSSGFDPALFHDDGPDGDGRSWLLNMLWDHRPDHGRFAGIVAQEVDLADGRLKGDRHVIFAGTPLGFTEGPHLYKRDGWYHLLVAEGGTGRNHAVVMARSRTLLGPYEVHPDGPTLTARDRPTAPLQRAGHGDLVETPSGETWMVHLCGRPLPSSDRCVLGRETAIRRMHWGTDGWLRTADDDDGVSAPHDPAADQPIDERHEFDAPTLPDVFQWLRTPQPDMLFSLDAVPGRLRLYGRESIGSQFSQALVARRQQAFRYAAETAFDHEPVNFQQMAGLVCYYNSTKYHYFHVTSDEKGGRVLQVLSALPQEPGGSSLRPAVPIGRGTIEMRVEVDHEALRFFWRMAGEHDWCSVGGTLDASILSDEATLPGLPNFTGAFVGMACQDMAGTGVHADFHHFTYTEQADRIARPSAKPRIPCPG